MEQPRMATATRPNRDIQGSGASTWLSELLGSRTLHLPHVATRMAEALGVGDVYFGLVGSRISLPQSVQDVKELHGKLQGRLDRQCAIEAVKAGVAHAKEGHYEEAVRCYDKAVQLDPLNHDAYVARGAARANQSDPVQAVRDLRHALVLAPGDANAHRYLSAIEAKYGNGQGSPGAGPREKGVSHCPGPSERRSPSGSPTSRGPASSPPLPQRLSPGPVVSEHVSDSSSGEGSPDPLPGSPPPGARRTSATEIREALRLVKKARRQEKKKKKAKRKHKRRRH